MTCENFVSFVSFFLLLGMKPRLVTHQFTNYMTSLTDDTLSFAVFPTTFLIKIPSTNLYPAQLVVSTTGFLLSEQLFWPFADSFSIPFCFDWPISAFGRLFLRSRDSVNSNMIDRRSGYGRFSFDFVKRLDQLSPELSLGECSIGLQIWSGIPV